MRDGMIVFCNFYIPIDESGIDANIVHEYLHWRLQTSTSYRSLT